MTVKNQIVTENYSIYNGDCMDVLPTLPASSIDLSIYSPPFAGLYIYSSSERDFSNCDSKEQFMAQFEFLIAEMARVTKPGRINAVHCQDIITHTTRHTLWDFPHEIIALYTKYGFTYNNRITIWKEPLEVRNRTMVNSLKHKQLTEDSTGCFTAVPDYVLIFKKGGENKIPVIHPLGFNNYAGDFPFTIDHLKNYGINEEIKSENMTEGVRAYIEKSFKALKDKFLNHLDAKTNKLSHIIWQRYASSVWDDIRNDNTLPFRDSREDDDEKHVHPLQLDVIDRLVELYSNENEVVLTPFMGVGSEVYSPVSLNRKAIGIELKDSYFKQAALNLKEAGNRFATDKIEQTLLF